VAAGTVSCLTHQKVTMFSSNRIMPLQPVMYSTQQQCKMMDVANTGTSKEWQMNFLLWTAPV